MRQETAVPQSDAAAATVTPISESVPNDMYLAHPNGHTAHPLSNTHVASMGAFTTPSGHEIPSQIGDTTSPYGRPKSEVGANDSSNCKMFVVGVSNPLPLSKQSKPVMESGGSSISSSSPTHQQRPLSCSSNHLIDSPQQ